ncbi:putative CoA-substrate-specific enzyme activase [Edaphobacter aggregans]|uniref:Putative CoA-substrate-specific enzyme activase n=1 Tax=Edaphobacter aggregans TaxID=570835 RepID=A0A428MG06_9BACT|nr:BadF/BadG/BcrA/BcrD ATPase family protein [Edaphobacter aggregans]RSL15669.1 putative CoA-substrate-specific enzyme activase [Edaphobacter aggregans]
MQQFLAGLDVGSTTVKAIVVDAATDKTIWQDYQRHETRQPEKVLEFLRRMEEDTGIAPENTRIFVTGSGGGTIAEMIGAKFVQEVHAVSLAVEKLHPEVYSVIELGGQDAKIIVFKDDEETGRKKKIPSMNDKCAGGTGAVIDKINAKLKIPAAELANQGYHNVKLHKVAGKCGVFAETDINGLQKTGTPSDELMASLFEAIVLQNLSVLTRGHTLRPHVLLLGGPNGFIRGMREAWQANIPRMWKERKVEIPEGTNPEELIKVPENAQYFAALGSVEFGKEEEPAIGRYLGTEKLIYYIDYGRAEEKATSGGKGLVAEDAELVAFKSAYAKKKFNVAEFYPGQTITGFIGIDAGSTSTKAVVLDKEGEILCKTYQLSNGNPIQDTIEVFEKLRAQIETKGATLEVLGVATTGYAKDILKDVLNADVALVETVAHTESALKFYDDPHVIVDVGGQDIKLIVLKDGRVKDFKLNTQCSAGNGYFLQSTAEGFGIKVDEFADIAFAAKSMPSFGYGCAVFMQSDIVNFQRQGWRSEEILAGLADVLPKNVFLYVASIPNLAALGTRFVLQGGTQNNLAVVKAEVDFIKSSFRANGREPEIIVHEHCGESGAIGAAQEALRLWRNGRQTTFIGLEAVANIRYHTTRNEDTRCYFCKNNCLRTFIDVDVTGEKSHEHKHSHAVAEDRAATVEEIAEVVSTLPSLEQIQANLPPVESHGSCSSGGHSSPSVFKAKVEPLVQIQLTPGSNKVVELPKPTEFQPRKTKVPLKVGEQRLIIATCEKGAVEDLDEMKGIKADIDKIKAINPNYVDIAARDVFRHREVEIVSDSIPSTKGLFFSKTTKERAALMEQRKEYRVGIPRLLNTYTYGPFFNAYFASLGLKSENIIYSDYTTPELYRAGASRGAIDPCYPSKIGIAHVYNLLATKHTKKPLHAIWFPMYDVLHTHLVNLTGSNACPTVTATPETVKAAFTKESDIFSENGIVYMDPILNLQDERICADQMFRAWSPVLGLSREENERAVAVGFKSLHECEVEIRRQARETLDQLEREDRIGIVMLGRVYHHDPGLNHEIMEEFQKLGYPVFSQSTLPLDEDLLDRLFGEEVRAGLITHPLDISDVWKNRYSTSTNHKVWAAKFTARHPNLVALEVSSFKCGHDAPIYGVIEGIIEQSGTPYFSFKDLDENKPSGSIRIRVETIDYFLRRYREDIIKRRSLETDIETQLAVFEQSLRSKPRGELAMAGD